MDWFLHIYNLISRTLWPEALWPERQFGQCHFGWWHFGQSDILAKCNSAAFGTYPGHLVVAFAKTNAKIQIWTKLAVSLLLRRPNKQTKNKRLKSDFKKSLVPLCLMSGRSRSTDRSAVSTPVNAFLMNRTRKRTPFFVTSVGLKKKVCTVNCLC